MERNLRRMAEYFRERRTKLRPHFKGHQVLSLADRQVQAGAIGISCARLDHAEALLAQGIPSVLVANEIAGENAIRRFVDISRKGNVIVAVDDALVIADMARLAGSRSSALNVLVDVDVGLHRGGVPPGEAALAFTRLILEKGLSFQGLMGYAGAIKLPPGREQENAVHSYLRPLLETKALIETSGVPVGIVSCGGTADYAVAGAAAEVTEIQAGAYLLMDTSYMAFAPDFQPCLTVLTTVISHAAGDRIVVDAGLKAVSSEKGLPVIKGRTNLQVRALHAEHALIDVTDPSLRLKVGDKVEMCVPYLDATLSLHQHMYAMRNDRVEEKLRTEH